MITRIREVRRARGMTLDDVAQACKPPTTPQTIGRLETGSRTVSIGWLNRIAEALGVEAADLVDGGGGDKAELPVIAVLGVQGASAPRRTAVVVAPRPKPSQVAITVLASNGDYRAGDEIWCDMVEPDGFGAAHLVAVGRAHDDDARARLQAGVVDGFELELAGRSHGRYGQLK